MIENIINDHLLGNNVQKICLSENICKLVVFFLYELA